MFSENVCGHSFESDRPSEKDDGEAGVLENDQFCISHSLTHKNNSENRGTKSYKSHQKHANLIKAASLNRSTNLIYLESFQIFNMRLNASEAGA